MITPDDLATERESIEASEWPVLAEQWLAAGYASPQLQRMASLTPEQAEAIEATYRREVLRSVGAQLPNELEHVQRCDQALALVQRDLDVTGFVDARFRTVVVDEYWGRVLPVYRAELIDYGWDHNTETMQALDDPVALLCEAANAVMETILENWLLAWPDCAEHDGPQLYATPKRSADGAGSGLVAMPQR